MGVPGMSDHEAWWEFWPYNSIVPIDFSATAGAEFDASVRWLGDSGGQADEYRFWFYNYANGQTDAFNTFVSAVDYQYAIYGAPSLSAEVVIERPTVNNKLTNLLNFGTLIVTSSQANGVSFGSYPQFWSNGEERHGVHMYNGGTELAAPSAIASNGYFTVAQESCN
jgi:hypothetical protein